MSVSNPSPHPDSETLLLWESGELDVETAARIKLHVQECGPCQETLGRFSSMYEDVAGVKAEAASWNLREAMNAKKRERQSKRRSSLRWITIGTAASVALVFAVSTFFNLTPTAQAEGLLLKASQREGADPASRNFFKLTNGGVECRMIADATGTRTVGVSNSTAVCDSAISHFRRAGWKSSDFLSAKNFQQWRGALPKKSDTVTKLATTTAITTETEANPLHKATLELRTADYEPVAGQFEFVSPDSGEMETFEVTKSEESFDPAVPATDPAPISETPHPESSAIADVPSADRLDLTEAQVRLALHRLGLDRDVLVAIERDGRAVKVWGLIAQPEKLSELRNAVGNLPDVRFAVVSEDNGPLPWRAYQGSGLPLAYDRVTALFPNNPQARQEFVNALDLSTRRVVAAARSREGVLALATKIDSAEQGSLLRQAASELQASISADLESLAGRLQPLADEPMASSAERMTAKRAMDLYMLVHEVVFLSRPDGSPSLEQALESIRSLLG